MTGRYQWTDEATEYLLCLWKKKGHAQRRPDYDSITSCMNAKGFTVSKKHCRSRMKNLMYRYKKAAKKARVAGQEVRERHFRQLSAIMGHSEETVPPLFYSEYDVKDEEDEGEEEEGPEEEQQQQQEQQEEEGEEVNIGNIMEPPQPHIVYISEADQNFITAAQDSTHLARSSSFVPQYQTAGTNFPIPSGEIRVPLLEALPAPGGYRSGGEQDEQEEVDGIIDVGQEVGTTTTDNAVQHNTTLGNRATQAKRGMSKDFLDFMILMQDKAEAREDARQQRLLEHERRMEVDRQQWRQKELRHQETLAHMVLQGMERLGQLIIFAQQQKPFENKQQETFENQPCTSSGEELGEVVGDQSEEPLGEQQRTSDEHSEGLKELFGSSQKLLGFMDEEEESEFQED